jgi:hypothetical protein
LKVKEALVENFLRAPERTAGNQQPDVALEAMADDAKDDNAEPVNRPNRAKKVAGRARRRRYVQGTRSYLHSVTNSAAKRTEEKQPRDE